MMNNNIITNRTSISRTHDSFFPKIKNSFEGISGSENEKNNYISPKKLISNNSSSNVPYLVLNNCNSPMLSPLRLEEGISLSIMKNTTNSRIKKFFYLPTFDIYFIKEIAMQQKHFVSSFKEKVSDWNKKLGSSNRFIKLINEFVNNPEG
jgi:hypothetical protein